MNSTVKNNRSTFLLLVSTITLLSGALHYYSRIPKELDSLPPTFKVTTFDDTFDKNNGAFMDTAAVMQQLDLIISVDTSIAHLAGALGKPVWVLLPYAADCRWHLNRTDSPWYPSMTLFRQTKTRDWSEPIQRIQKALPTVIAQTKKDTNNENIT